MTKICLNILFVLSVLFVLFLRYKGATTKAEKVWSEIALHDTIAILDARVINSPEFVSGKAQIYIKVLSGDFKDLMILIFTKGYGGINYGDIVSFKGTMAVPQDFDDFSYKEYLSSKGILAVAFNPELNVISHSHSVFAKLFTFKTAFVSKLESIYPSPHSKLISGMLLGVDAGFPAELKENLGRAGLLHLVVVSGGNLAFVLAITWPSLLFLGLKKSRAFLLTGMGLFTYALLVGFEPPVLRALIMALIMLIGAVFERPYYALRALCITAFVMIFFNPLLVKSASFQLSFAATAGIAFFSTPLTKFFYGKMKWKDFSEKLVSGCWGEDQRL